MVEPTAATRLCLLVESTGVEVASLCLNEVLTSPIDEVSGDLVKRLRPVLSNLPIRIVVVPLLEASDVRSVDQLSAVRSLLLLADHLLDDEGRVVVELGLSAARQSAVPRHCRLPTCGVVLRRRERDSVRI